MGKLSAKSPAKSRQCKHTLRQYNYSCHTVNFKNDIIQSFLKILDSSEVLMAILHFVDVGQETFGKVPLLCFINQASMLWNFIFLLPDALANKLDRPLVP